MALSLTRNMEKKHVIQINLCVFLSKPLFIQSRDTESSAFFFGKCPVLAHTVIHIYTWKLPGAITVWSVCHWAATLEQQGVKGVARGHLGCGNEGRASSVFSLSLLTVILSVGHKHASLTFEAIVWHFGKSAYSVSGGKLGEKIDKTLMSVSLA